MDYKNRILETKIDELFEIFPVVALTGPRQAGKSTLIKHYIDKNWKYYSLDNRELLLRIKSDSTLFVKSLDSHVAIDEAQKCPELFHAVKEIIDSGFPFRILLSGSANFLLLKSITESLAGRVGLLELLPFSLAERFDLAPNRLVEIICNSDNIDRLFKHLSGLNERRLRDEQILDFIFTGGYPKIHSLKSEAAGFTWFQNYISTYLERDLRDLAQVGDLDTFQKVYKLIAYQNANMLNMSAVASDLGISVQTIKKYISILETSYHVKLLPAYSYNQKKQIMKTPKIYYLDTGLINYFVQNRSRESMLYSGDWGALLEAHVFAELYKEIKDMVPRPGLYFWRTNNGAEVDFVLEYNKRLFPVEVKSAVQIKSSSVRGLKSFSETQENITVPFAIVFYRGEEVVYLNESTLAVPLGLLF